ncbi:MAG: TOMM precursor leader peptide-binding protein [Chloroflexi bacterium]|nr:TOMM precursor leader peptide-binding protein [Chloroflexota bacterium]
MVTAPDAGRAGPLPVRPLMKPWYRVVHQRDSVTFQYGRSLVVVRGDGVSDLFVRLLPLLDGRRTSEEIDSLFGDAERPSIGIAIRLLNARELLMDGTEVTAKGTENPSIQFLIAALGISVSPDEIASSLAEARLGVLGGSPTADELGTLLAEAGVRVERVEPASDHLPPAGSSLVIACPDPGQPALLGRINEKCLRLGLPWMQILPFDGDTSVIGPLYLPGQTCCYECFRLRRLSNSEFPKSHRLLEATPATFPSAVSLDRTVAGMAALLLLRWFASDHGQLPGWAYTFQLNPTMSLASHRVYRVPRCPKCGPDWPAPAPGSIVSPWDSRGQAGGT